MAPKSWINTPNADTAPLQAGLVQIHGVGFGGMNAVRGIDVSVDGGKTWTATELGRDYGKFSFRQWNAHLKFAKGDQTVMVRCTNTDGLQQPMTPNWNPGGFMRNVVESTRLMAV